MKKIIKIFLDRLGYKIVSTSRYIEVDSVVANAIKADSTICDFLEDEKSKESGCSRIKGRRDRIVENLTAYGISRNVESVLEIGPGSGNFTEIYSKSCDKYEIYEMHAGWAAYLKKQYNVLVKQCDGSSLKGTTDNSIDIIHAHAIFVYIPILTVYDYLEEAARVLKPDGKMVFNIFTNKTFSIDNTMKWKNSEHRFPVIVPEILLIDFIDRLGLSIVGKFEEIYGPACSAEYFILQKNSV